MNASIAELRKLDPAVLPAEQREAAQASLEDDLRKRIRAANARSTDEWHRIRTRDHWQRFRDAKVKLLRASLGLEPARPPKPDTRTTGTIAGDGFHVDKLAFRSREGLWITANLYRPARPPKPMPGILICHSHHAPKEQGELQDMGMTWARAGCVVLVPDMLGHGERRQHPFKTAGDFAKPFRVGRQDYHFRYDVGMQLQLLGDSLMGWFVWDLSRCVDVLCARPGVDPKRIILLGAVAGGGDPAAVTAALDERIAAAVVFNFGGPQPETVHPLPERAEDRFNYAGGGSFESTRNLRRSAAEGFLPWVIVGAIAPRRLIYAHEFSWDREHDPVWKRLETIWGLYGQGERLAGIHGRGTLRERPPAASHCTNIGPLHREGIQPVLKRWFGIAVGPDEEYSARRDRDELTCMTAELAAKVKPRRLCELLPELASRRIAAASENVDGDRGMGVSPMRPTGVSPVAIRQDRGPHGRDGRATCLPAGRRTGQDARATADAGSHTRPEKLASASVADRRKALRQSWARVLGDVDPGGAPKAQAVGKAETTVAGAKVECIVLTVADGAAVPVILLLPKAAAGGPAPCVVAVGEGGKAAFLRLRTGEIAQLLAGGSAVCLPDLRGTGETQPKSSRERWGGITSDSATELMLGGTFVGSRLRDLRSVLAHLRTRKDVDARRIALWGDSLIEPMPADATFRMPRNVDGRPHWAEPLGGLLALLGGLFADDVAAVCVRGGLSDFRSVLSEQCVYVPHDVVVPGLLTTGDLPTLAAALAPTPLRLERLVDGQNRLRTADQSRTLNQPALDTYRRANSADRIAIDQDTSSIAPWLLKALGLPSR